jgi:vitamin B12 transporter
VNGPARNRGVRLWAHSSLSIVLLAFGPSWAADPTSREQTGDDPGAADSGIEERPRYYGTATVTARPVDSATGALAVLTREQIEALDVVSVAELIRHIPGLDLVSSGPRGGVAYAQIQGGEPNFTIVLLDGVPLNDSTDNFGGAVNLNSISSRQIERIEVIRGPISSFYGSAGLSGVVNIITRQGDSDRPVVAAGLAAGNFDVRQASVSVSRGHEENNYFVGATWEQEQDRVLEDEFKQLAIQGKSELELGEKTRLRVAGRAASWDTEDYPENSGGVLGTRELRHSENDEASLNLEFLVGPKRRAHTIRGVVYWHEMKRDTPLIPNASDPFASIPPTEEETEFLQWRLGWAYPVIQREKTSLTVGAGGVLEDGETRAELVGLPPDLANRSYDLERLTGSGILEFQSEQGRFEIEAGLRLDAPEGFDTQFSPRIGLAYRLRGDRTRLRLSAGQAFKLPSFFALGDPLVGDPGLKPEYSLGGDLGLEHRFDSARVRTTLSAFYYEYSDLIDFDPLVGPFGRLVNRAEVRSHGGVLDVAWNATERIDLRFGTTYQNVEDVATGEPLVHRPKWYGSAAFDWRITSRLRLNVDGQWVSENHDVQIAVPDRDSVAAYRLLGASFFVRITDNWRLDTRVDNLLDEEYELLIGFPGSSRAYRVGLRFQTR